MVAPGAPLSLTPGGPGESAEAALAGGLLRPLGDAPLTAPDEPGEHWLAVVGRDDAGNASEVRWVRLAVDAAGPAVEISFDPPPVAGEDGRLWLPGGAVARALADDAPAGVAATTVAIGGRLQRGGETGAELTVDGPGDGGTATTTVSAWAEDRVGNRSEEARLEVGVDREPPAGVIEVAGDRIDDGAGGWVVGPATPCRAAFTDAGSGLAEVALSIDGEPADDDGWAGPWTPGTHRLAAAALDRVGNRGEIGPQAIVVDAEPPALSWTVAAERSLDLDGGTIHRPPVTMTVAAADEPAGVAAVEWSTDGEDWQPLASSDDRGGGSGSVVTAAAGLRLRARDRVGNAGGAEAVWRVDGEPPRLALAVPGGGRVPPGGTVNLPIDGRVEVVAEDSGCGVASARQAIDGGPWLPLPNVGDFPDPIRFRAEGSRRLAIEVEDRLGNSTIGEWTVVVAREASDGR